jgi:hypothetical protein
LSVAFNRELPTNFLDIRTDRHRFQKVNSKLLCFNSGQALEDSIFKTRKPLRKPKFMFISVVIIFLKRAPDSATMRTVIASTLNDFIRSMMRLETRQVLFFYCQVTVKRFHLVLS